MRRPQTCSTLFSSLRNAGYGTRVAHFATAGVEGPVESRHSKSQIVVDAKSKFSDIFDPKKRFSVVAEEQRFLSIYQQARADNDMQKVYRVAASLIKSTTVPSGLVWQCALREKIDFRDVMGFLACYRLMLASQHCLDLGIEDSFYLWQEAIEMFWLERECIDLLLEHARSTLTKTKKSHVYVFVMEMAFDNANEDSFPVLEWHSRMLQENFIPDEHGQRQIVGILTAKEHDRHLLAKLSIQFEQAGVDIDLESFTKQELHRQRHTVTSARTQSSMSISQESAAITAPPLEASLRYHVKFSDRAKTLAFIDAMLSANLKLTQRDLCTVGYFYGSIGDFGRLSSICKSQFGAHHDAKEDAIWAAAIKGAVKGGLALLPVLKSLQSQGARIGAESLHSCVELSQSLEESQKFISHMLSQNMQVALRSYATFIRHLARSGDVSKAQHLLEVASTSSSSAPVPEKDAVYLRRCFMLGLFEGAHYEELEATHARWCLQKLDRADTWNLLIRSRTVDRRVQQALQALKEMGTRGIDVENATAQELMGAVLRYRRPGRNPDVLDTSDTRPYLKDIKTAIGIGHKCLQLGGRTQPETWREVMKRLSLYGEFDALEVLTDWLIPQYSLDQSKAPAKRYYVHSADQKLLANHHVQHPLSRLIRQRDIAAIVTRGFVNDRPVEALTLIAKWQSMSVFVDPVAVDRRIEVGLKYLQRDLDLPAALIKDLADELRPVSDRITKRQTIRNSLV